MSRNILPIASRQETARLAWRLVASRRVPLLLTIASLILAGLCALVAPWVLGTILHLVIACAPQGKLTPAALVIAADDVVGELFDGTEVAFVAPATNAIDWGVDRGCQYV